MVNITQLVRVLDCDSKRREFKSHYSPKVYKFMNYTKQKYIQQKFNVNTIFSSCSYFGLFQLKSILISEWLAIQTKLKSQGIFIKFCSLKLLKLSKIYTVFSKELRDFYNGKLVVLYTKNMTYQTMQLIASFQVLLIPIKIVCNNRFLLKVNDSEFNHVSSKLIHFLESCSYKPAQPKYYEK